MPITVGDTPITISEDQIGAAVSEGVRSRARYGHRADAASPVSPGHVEAQRAMVVHMVEQQAVRAARMGGRADAAPERKAALVHAIASGLGLREVDGRIDGMEAHRADSRYRGEGVATDFQIVRPAEQARAITEAIPTRSIGASNTRARVRFATHTGSADLSRPGMTQIPRADSEKSSRERLVHSLITSTRIEWERMLYASDGVDDAAEAAESARRVLLDALERVCVEGVEDLDFQGIRQLQASKAVSEVDYTDDSTTLGDIYKDLVKMILGVQEANDDRGAPPNTLMIAPAWLRKIMPANNIDDGGSLTGNAIAGAMMSGDQRLASVMRAVGIDTVIPAPSLNHFGEKASTTSQAGAVLCQLPQSQGLRKIVALAPSPVRTASDLSGDSTLWAMRIAGVEAPVATSIGKLHAKVR